MGKPRYVTLLSDVKLKSFTLSFLGNVVNFNVPDKFSSSFSDGDIGFNFLYDNVASITRDTKQVDGSELVNLDWIKEDDIEIEFSVRFLLNLSPNLRVLNKKIFIELKEVLIEETSSIFTTGKVTPEITTLIKTARDTFGGCDFILGKGMTVQFETKFEVTL